MGPWLLPIVGVLFLAIGFFTIVVARKRLRQARALGQPAVWYKNLGLLTGFEYVLLGVIVFLNLSNVWVPDALKPAFAIFYTSILFLAIIFLFAVVFIGLRQPRKKLQATQTTTETAIDSQSPEERAAEVQRKRERRQKAAAARRRRTGRA